jgi:hypothetical protein
MKTTWRSSMIHMHFLLPKVNTSSPGAEDQLEEFNDTSNEVIWNI